MPELACCSTCAAFHAATTQRLARIEEVTSKGHFLNTETFLSDTDFLRRLILALRDAEASLRPTSSSNVFDADLFPAAGSLFASDVLPSFSLGPTRLQAPTVLRARETDELLSTQHGTLSADLPGDTFDESFVAPTVTRRESAPSLLSSQRSEPDSPRRSRAATGPPAVTPSPPKPCATVISPARANEAAAARAAGKALAPPANVTIPELCLTKQDSAEDVEPGVMTYGSLKSEYTPRLLAPRSSRSSGCASDLGVPSAQGSFSGSGNGSKQDDSDDSDVERRVTFTFKVLPRQAKGARVRSSTSPNANPACPWTHGPNSPRQVSLAVAAVLDEQHADGIGRSLDADVQAAWKPLPLAVPQNPQFIDDVEEGHRCPMCQLVMEEAVCLPACGHSFCKRCLDRAPPHGAGRIACPMCGKAKGEPVPNYSLRNVIGLLKVKCRYLDCSKVLPLTQLASHMASCQAVPHQCALACSSDPSDLCTTVLTQSRLWAAHRLQCPYVRVNCRKGCGALVSRKMLQHHEINDCPNVPQRCRQCSAEFKRGSLHECALETVICPFCGAAVIRRDMEDHVRQSTAAHLDSLRKLLQNQSERTDALLARYHDLRGRFIPQSVNAAAHFKATWTVFLQRHYCVYESPEFTCQGYPFALRLYCDKLATKGGEVGHDRRTTMDSSQSFPLLQAPSATPRPARSGLFLRSYSEAPLRVNWWIRCNGFEGGYLHHFTEKGSEAGTWDVLEFKGEAVRVELHARVMAVQLEGAAKKSTNVIEKYDREKRQKRMATLVPSSPQHANTNTPAGPRRHSSKGIPPGESSPSGSALRSHSSTLPVLDDFSD